MNDMLMKFCVSVTMAGCIASCGAGEDNKSEMLDDFMIMAYSGPPLAEVSLERYQEIADAGIGYLVPGNGTFNEEQNLRAMELGAQVGIGIIPVDLRLSPFELKPGMEVDAAAITEIVNSYKDSPALASYVVKDEPGGDLFPALREICDVFRAEDPAHEPLINLFPNYGTIHQFGVDDYPTYVRSYMKIVEPRLLSYDSYPLRNGGVTIYDDWYSNLEVVREEARKAKIPFLVFIQSQGIKKGLRVPNRAEILWQVNTVLAYGAQGVGWFTYWTPAPDQGLPHVEGAAPPMVESHHNAMIDINGKRTEVYDYVKEANFHLKKAGRGLLGWDNTDVARYEAGKRVAGTSPVATPVGVGANIVIGTFRKDGKIRLVVSNASCEEPTRFSLTLVEEWISTEIFASIAAQPIGDEWSLEPGGSVLLDLK